MVKFLFIFLQVFTVPELPSAVQADTSYVVVTDIAISGNSRTKASIISRELTFKVGDTLSTVFLPEIIKRSRNNVFNTNLFLTTEVTTNNTAENGVVINVTVKERWYLLVLPILFLADRNFNEWWYERERDLRRLTYGVQIRHFNLTGNNDQLALRAYGGFIPFISLSYNRPYIDRRQRMGINGGIFFSTQRTMPFRTWEDKLDFIDTDQLMRQRWGANIEYTLRNALYHTHSLYAGYTSTAVADTILSLNPNYFLNEENTQRYMQFRYTYRYDKRDNIQYALKGDLLVAGISKFGINRNSDVDQLSLAAVYTRFFPIKGKLFGDVTLSGKVSAPQLQPYTLTTGLGFRNNLVRGYDLYVIDGQNYGLVRTNLKYQLLNQTFDLKRFIKIKQFSTLPIAAYLNTYADAGYVKNYFPEFSNTSLGNRFLIGGGVGLDIISWYNTAGRISYSFNQLGESKLFFSIVRTL